MQKYTVRRPIEHNQKLYLPQANTGPERVKSVGHGQEIPVDVSGAIELSEKEAQCFTAGQIEAVSESVDTGKQSKRGKG